MAVGVFPELTVLYILAANKKSSKKKRKPETTPNEFRTLLTVIKEEAFRKPLCASIAVCCVQMCIAKSPLAPCELARVCLASVLLASFLRVPCSGQACRLSE